MDTNKTDANRDPITGAPGSHPVGTGVGAAVGGIAAGAAAGSVAGPIGTWSLQRWRGRRGLAAGRRPNRSPREDNTGDNLGRPYIDSSASYDDYGPAYGYGVNSYSKYPGRSFDDVESDLSRDWESARGQSSLGWDRAKNATRDAWDRVSDTVERAVPGDSDRDGK